MFAVNNVPVAVYRVWALGASEVRFTVALAGTGALPPGSARAARHGRVDDPQVSEPVNGQRTPGSRYTIIFHRREATSRPHTADPLYAADCCLSLEIVTAAARARGSSHAANTAPVYSFWNVMSTEYR